MFTEEERTALRGEVHCLRPHSSRQRSELEARQGPGLLWLERVGLVEWGLFTSPGSEGPSGGDLQPSSLAWEPCGRGPPRALSEYLAGPTLVNGDPQRPLLVYQRPALWVLGALLPRG